MRALVFCQMMAYSGKRPKDENKPKRPQSAYFLFLADFRAQNKTKFEGVPGAHKELIRAGKDAPGAGSFLCV